MNTREKSESDLCWFFCMYVVGVLIWLFRMVITAYGTFSIIYTVMFDVHYRTPSAWKTFLLFTLSLADSSFRTTAVASKLNFQLIDLQSSYIIALVRILSYIECGQGLPFYVYCIKLFILWLILLITFLWI